MTFKKTLYTALCLAGIIFPIATVAEDRALIVGINAYSSRPLAGCRQDAKNMERLIKKVWDYKPTQIKMLLDKAATRQAILSAFDNWLIDGTRRGDRVLFYYSGHGYHLADNNGDEDDDGLDETICPVDSASNARNMITDDEINSRMRKLSGRQVMVISDSCHSGTVTRGISRTNNPYVKLLELDWDEFTQSKRGAGRPEAGYSGAVERPLTNVIAYSAVSPSQVALDGGPRGGIFTNAFIRGLEQKAADYNRDGKVTHQELLTYVRQESQAYCDNNNSCGENNGRLTPQLDADAKWLSVDVTKREAISESIPIPVPPVGPESNILQAKMFPSQKFRLGDTMQINITSRNTGYLFVLDIDTNGKLTVIFPNEYSEKRNLSGLINQGDTVTIPDESYGFKFEAQEPTGEGLVIALLIEENEDFVENLRKEPPLLQRGFVPIEGTNKVQAALQQLQQKLNQTLTTADGPGRPIKWSMADIEYRIDR